jgi:hypothetical protein
MRKGIIFRAYTEAEWIACKHRLYKEAIPTAEFTLCLM